MPLNKAQQRYYNVFVCSESGERNAEEKYEFFEWQEQFNAEIARL